MANRKCTKCGHVEGEFTFFCTVCGAQTAPESGGNVPTEKKTEAPKNIPTIVSKTPKKQTENVKIENEVSSESLEVDTTDLPQSEVENQQTCEDFPVDEPTMTNEEVPTSEKSESNTKTLKLIIGIISAVILIGIIIVIIIVLKNNDSKEDNNNILVSSEKENQQGKGNNAYQDGIMDVEKTSSNNDITDKPVNDVSISNEQKTTFENHSGSESDDKNTSSIEEIKQDDKVDENHEIVDLEIDELILSQENVILEIGDEYQLYANVDSGDLHWWSDNSDIVLVDNGRIKAASSGEANVLAFYGSLISKCHIIVNKPPKVVLDEKNLNSMIKKITASSTLKEKTITHKPENLIDNDKTTCWCESVNGPGIGEYIKVEFNSIVTITELDILNGYMKKESTFDKNSKLAKITIEYSGGKVDVELDKLTYKKASKLDYSDAIRFNEPIETDYITIYIKDTYKGNTYEDTCVSEIRILGDSSYQESQPEIKRKKVEDVESEVLKIRKIYKEIEANRDKKYYTVKEIKSGVKEYIDPVSYEVICIVIKKGIDGIDYTRYYYFNNEELMFAYLEGDDAHRLYFKDGYLFRWRYTANSKNVDKAINHDNETTSDYLEWEDFAIREAETYVDIFIPSDDEDEWYEGYDEYIFFDSDTRYLSSYELIGLSKDECKLARNEIYARRGRKFKDKELQEYFNSKSWYHGTISPDDFDEKVFNEYEIANKDLIVEYEKAMGYRK